VDVRGGFLGGILRALIDRLIRTVSMEILGPRSRMPGPSLSYRSSHVGRVALISVR